MNADITYLEMLKHVLIKGTVKGDRTGTGTISTFGLQARYDLQESFPILTTKKIPFHLVVSELLWFLKGDTNIRYLLQHNNNIWNEWGVKQWFESAEYTGPDMTNFGQRIKTDEHFRQVYEDQLAYYKAQVLSDDAFAQKYGNLGNVYGKQWRMWEGDDGETIDQIKGVINDIKTSQDSRRLIVTAWNPKDVINAGKPQSNAVLPPCHAFFQFYVQDGKLSCMLTQRSADMFLGVPFNIASYALLTELIARECDLGVGEFIHSIGDGHIYNDHITQVLTQLKRDPIECYPGLSIAHNKSLYELEPNDISLIQYESHPTIKADVSV